MTAQPLGIIVLMGVSGSGKSTIGSALAARAGAVFADADDYHPQSNVDKMHSGIPLTDEDREPWLEILNNLLKEWHASGTSGVLGCSALKETYRQTLKSGMPEGTVRFVLLELPREQIAERMAARPGHFMPPALLDSQIATLEAPAYALHITNDAAPDAVVDKILEGLNKE